MPITVQVGTVDSSAPAPFSFFEVDFSLPIANVVPRWVQHFGLPTLAANDTYEYALQKLGEEGMSCVHNHLRAST
jgi:hypothetical protein